MTKTAYSMFVQQLYIFLSVFNSDYVTDTEDGKTLSKLVEQLKPLVPWARSIADKIKESANEASVIIPKMTATGNKLKGTVILFPSSSSSSTS